MLLLLVHHLIVCIHILYSHYSSSYFSVHIFYSHFMFTFLFTFHLHILSSHFNIHILYWHIHLVLVVGMWAHALTVTDYQDLINRNWRRYECIIYCLVSMVVLLLGHYMEPPWYSIQLNVWWCQLTVCQISYM